MCRRRDHLVAAPEIFELREGIGSVPSVPPNKRLERAGPPGQGSMDHLMDREAEVERRIVRILVLCPQLKRVR